MLCKLCHLLSCILVSQLLHVIRRCFDFIVVVDVANQFQNLFLFNFAQKIVCTILLIIGYSVRTVFNKNFVLRSFWCILSHFIQFNEVVHIHDFCQMKQCFIFAVFTVIVKCLGTLRRLESGKRVIVALINWSFRSCCLPQRDTCSVFCSRNKLMLIFKVSVTINLAYICLIVIDDGLRLFNTMSNLLDLMIQNVYFFLFVFNSSTE